MGTRGAVRYGTVCTNEKYFRKVFDSIPDGIYDPIYARTNIVSNARLFLRNRFRSLFAEGIEAGEEGGDVELYTVNIRARLRLIKKRR